MREIKETKKIEEALWNTGEEPIAELEQRVVQYDNYALRAYHYQDSIVIMEDAQDGNPHWYLLTADEATDIEGTLREMAAEWARNEDDERLERLRWGLDEPEDIVVSEDYDGEVKIIEVGCYGGYSPIGYVTDDTPRCDEMVFASYAEAQAWIDAEYSHEYSLGHNEMGRPTYYIVAAA